MIDGVGFYTYNPANKNADTWPFDADQYLLLNVAMGGVAGDIDDNFVESSMVIDYVRVYQNNPLSIKDEFASKFDVYPNPSSNYINISSKDVIDNLELYNAIGQLVLQKRQPGKQLNIEDLNSGIYMLKIYSKNASTTKKIVIN
jgi:beta-glucanase (GH16 family)